MATPTDDIAIRVEHLGKLYRIGQRDKYKTLRESMMGWFGRGAKAEPTAASSKDFWALDDVNFEVKRGEVVGIIGRNGAGKSTLLKVLSRITEPTRGRVEITGRVGSLLEVGTGFHPELTGRENVFLNGAILGMREGEIRKKFDEIVAFAEIEQFIDTPVKRYSSGMYTRLAFAVAAHLEPEILIVDEVLAVGDAAFQKKCLGKMKDIAGQGRTVLFVSHNMNAVENLCTSVLRLKGGTRVAYGATVRAIINEHLAGSDALASSTAEWRDDEDAAVGREASVAAFVPRALSVCDEFGTIVGDAQRADRRLFVRAEIDVRDVDRALSVGIAVYDDGGTLFYHSFHTDGPEERWPRVRQGRNVFRVALPSRLLNEGTFRVELIGGIVNRGWTLEPGRNAPAVQFDIAGGLSESPLWMVRRPGILAPMLSWEIE